MKKEWTQLTKENIDDALKCAGIAFLAKNNKTGLVGVPNDRWYWDMTLQVGKTKHLGICISMWHDPNPPYKEYTLHVTPTTVCPKNMEWIKSINKPKSDEDAVKILSDVGKNVLTTIAKRGVREFSYSYPIGDDEWEGGTDWVLGSRLPVYFKMQKSRGDLGGFRSIQN